MVVAKTVFALLGLEYHGSVMNGGLVSSIFDLDGSVTWAAPVYIPV